MESVLQQIRGELAEKIMHKYLCLKSFLQFLDEECRKLPLKYKPGKFRRWIRSTPEPTVLLGRVMESPMETTDYTVIDLDTLRRHSILIDAFVADACAEAEILIDAQIRAGFTRTIRTKFMEYSGGTLFDRYVTSVSGAI